MKCQHVRYAGTAKRAYLVSEHQNVRVLHEVPVDILKRSSGRFRIEQVHERHESSVENSPDNVELPPKVSNSDRSDFNHDEVAFGVSQPKINFKKNRNTSLT